ncbi:Leucine-rich repeat flightless-interacting protein 2 [Papilio machaon]|uniref:Leucine-rich repeat flightless-interacting protein 2 n=1 Tax=Papilio machaon TaxID=76193 RepID=A0A194QR72_PAPMA|nr:Leucine-rich repeat flightless-interacting protein 2 [Papilio machaon]
MGHKSEQTPDNSDEESGEAFTDGDFDDSGEEAVIERSNVTKISQLPINDTVNPNVDICKVNDPNNENQPVTNGNDDNAETVDNVENGHCAPLDDLDNYMEQGVTDARKDSQSEINPSIVGILGDQHNHAEQRLAARRAARAEAREIRMRELERQQREQEDHADKAFDMYSETVGRRGGRLASLSPAVHSPRRSSEDSADDVFSIKDLRHELKEVEEKFRKAMILNAQLDNDKAALGYQLELLKDRIEELTEEHAQLQREHKEKCSAHERLKREHATLEREVTAARDAVRARDSAAAAAGFAFVEAELNGTAEQTELNGMEPELVAQGFGSVPPLALVSHHSEQLLNDAGEGTLDVRLQRLVSSKQALESEVRKLKLCLNEERAARQNGVAAHHDRELDSEREYIHAHTHALTYVQRIRTYGAREALNRVEELETENSHLTKRLDKLKNAKSALLKEL